MPSCFPVYYINASVTLVLNMCGVYTSAATVGAGVAVIGTTAISSSHFVDVTVTSTSAGTPSAGASVTAPGPTVTVWGDAPPPGMPAASIAGITIGSVAALLLAVILWVLVKRARQGDGEPQQEVATQQQTLPSAAEMGVQDGWVEGYYGRGELDGNGRVR